MDVECLSGRELDALVAQYLFGLDVQRRPDRATGEQDIFYNATPRVLKPRLLRVPEYCRCVSASIDVENKLRDRGWRRHSPPPGWRPGPSQVVTVVLEHHDRRRVNATGPFERALCRAALKAVTP